MDKSLLDIMETSEGRKFVWELLEGAGTEQGNFNPDPYRNAWLAGRASLGVELLNVLRSTDRGFELECIMRREARHPPDVPVENEDEDNFYE